MTLKLRTRDGWWVFRDALMFTPEDFTTHGSLWGINRMPYESERSMDYVAGDLPLFYRDSFWRADYAVYSYATPIAWRTDGVWITPGIKYSVTTSRHQGKIFTALSQIGA